MKRIKELITNIPADKLLHKDVCFCISFFIIKATRPIIGLVASLIIANLIAIGIGYIKEKYDDRDHTKNVFDIKDLYADIIGSILGSIFAII